jgi:hypothetical protein
MGMAGVSIASWMRAAGVITDAAAMRPIMGIGPTAAAMKDIRADTAGTQVDIPAAVIPAVDIRAADIPVVDIPVADRTANLQLLSRAVERNEKRRSCMAPPLCF